MFAFLAVAFLVFFPLFATVDFASAVTYDYYINKSGATYQALDSGRNIIAGSSSSSAIINYLLGASGVAASGSDIDVEAAAYTADATWHIYINSVYLYFETGAVVSATTNLNTPVIWVHSNNVIINHATIDGNAAIQTFTGSERIDGVVWSGANGLLEYSSVYDLRCFGVSIDGSGDNTGVMNCYIADFGWNGIACYDTSNNYFVNNEVAYGGDVGINSYGVNTKITGNYVHDMNGTTGSNNAHIGIGCEDDTYTTTGGTGGGNYLLIANNTVVNVNSGVTVSSWSVVNINYVMISGNTLINCDLGYLGAIIIDSDYDILSYNTITTASIGINIKVFGATSSYNTVYGNTFTSCTHNIVDGGTGTIYTAPSIVAITVTSSPLGANFVTANGVAGYAGAYSTSPYTFTSTSGNTIALVANTVSGQTFTSWSDGGAQSHSVTTPSANAVYRAVYTSGSSGSTTFGTTTIGGSHTTFYSGQPRTNQYSPTANGTVTDIMLYMTGSGAGRYAKVGIYADNGADTPSTLLAESSNEEITSDGWHDFSGFSLPVINDTLYWLACSAGDSNLELYYVSGGANFWQADTSGYSYPTFPNPYVTFSTMANYNVSIYAVYSTDADTTPPTNGTVTASTTQAGVSCVFQTTINDNVALEPNGKFYFYSNNTGTITLGASSNFTVTPFPAYASIVLNSTVGAKVAYEFNFTDNAGNSASTGWMYLTTTGAATPTPAPTSTPLTFTTSIDTSVLWQYLNNYDFVGFIIACWTINLGESFYVIISMIATIGLYIRMKNLPVMIAMWFCLGFLWIGLIPMASPIIFLLIILGIASLLFYLYGLAKY